MRPVSPGKGLNQPLARVSDRVLTDADRSPSSLRPKWYQNGTWRVEKIEKRGDPEKKPNKSSHVAPFLTKNDEKVLVFKAILKNRKVEKRSSGSIRGGRF